MKNSGQVISIEGNFLKTARLEEEWYVDLENPEVLIQNLKKDRCKADIFTFWQRYPDTEPRHNYYYDYDELAVLPIKGYDYWYKNQIGNNAKRMIKKAAKENVLIKMEKFDDNFVRGMEEIFNESSIRQGRHFTHYGKDFDIIKRDFSRFLFREDIIGAYYEGELIGFVMLANAGNYALPTQILSKIKYRDKGTNNALIAKVVEICSEKNYPYFIYFNWSIGPLSEFKRRCGCEKKSVPRYYVPLSLKGKIAIKLNLHKGLKNLLPERIYLKLLAARKKFNAIINK